MVPGLDEKNFDFFSFLFAGRDQRLTALRNGKNNHIKTA